MYLVYVYSLVQEGNQEAIEFFKVREFACKSGDDRIQISPVLMEILPRIRLYFKAPVTITSGYRTFVHIDVRHEKARWKG